MTVEAALPGLPGDGPVNANKPRRLWENREIFTGSAYRVIVVTGSTKTLVPAAVAGLVPVTVVQRANYPLIVQA